MKEYYPTGRNAIYTNLEEINSSNVIEAVKDSYQRHNLNSFDIQMLYEFYKGNQPILDRVKTIRPDINNIVVENIAYSVVSFFSGYIFGDPIQYVRRGAVTHGDVSGDRADSTSIAVGHLNEFMAAEDKATVDKEIGDWLLICGVAYRGVLPDKLAGQDEDDSPFEVAALDPRNTFLVRSNRFSKRPLMGVQIIPTGGGKKLFAAWTQDRYYEIQEGSITKNEPHYLGGIPIIEYTANNVRMGAFEHVIPLLNALNKVQSDRINGVEQFIQSFMKFINAEVDADGLEELKELGAILIRSEPQLPADVDIVSAELDQQQTQTLVDDLTNSILVLCGMPDRGGAPRGSGDTGQAVMLRDGWAEAETKAKSIEMAFKKSEKEFLKLALIISRDKRGMSLKLSDIDIKFTRNRTDNLLVKVQGLQGMLEAGIHPQIAISMCGLFSDSEQVYLDSMPFLEKWVDYRPPSDKNQRPLSRNAERKREMPDEVSEQLL